MRIPSFLILPAVLIAATLSLPLQAQEFNREQAVTSAEIRAGGFKIQLQDGTVVQITGVTVAQGRSDCLIHLPSLRASIETGLSNGSLRPIGTAAQSVSLQARIDPRTAELWCGGVGAGCTIIIQ
ncbi:MAG: hypothetical protein ACFCVH_10630 [Alphaproteobacteria bacterium]